MKLRSNKNAFTLIELSISLLVIGLIIAAVMGGAEIIKSADSKQFYQNFARKWTTIIDSYYDRMGSQFTDSVRHGGTGIIPDGYFDGVDILDNEINFIRNSGINLNRVVSTNQSRASQYSIQGEFTDYVIVQVHLASYTYENTMYNFLVLRNIPIDIAVGIDKYIDGVSDGTTGNAITLQTSAIDITLPINQTDLTPVSGSLLMDYNSVNTITRTTNIGIIIEH